MKKNILSALLFFLLAINSSQAALVYVGSTTFNGSANGFDMGRGIVYRNQSSELFVTGASSTTGEGRNIWLGRFDAPASDTPPTLLDSISITGNPAASTDDGYGISIHPSNGDLYVTGRIYNSPNNLDGYIARYTPSLTLVSSVTFTGAYGADSDEDFCQSSSYDSAGNVYVAGTVEQSLGENDIFVGKYSANLGLITSALFDGPGGIGDGDLGYGVWVDKVADIVYVCGRSGNSDGGEIIVYKLNSSLTFISSTTLNGSATSSSDCAMAITGNPATQNLYVAGYVEQTTTGLDIWIGKYDFNLNLLSSTTIDYANFGDEARGITTWGTDIVVSGYTGITATDRAMWVGRYNQNLVLLSSHTFNPNTTNDENYDVAIDIAANKVYTVGGVPTNQNDIAILKYADSPAGDTTPPAAISNLTALVGGSAGEIQLKWTAPGDDGTTGGSASSYEVRYATKYIGTADYNASWTSAYSQSWGPAAPGSQEPPILAGFSEGVTYWFAIKATDDASNQASWTSSGTVSSVNTLNSAYAKSDSNLLPSIKGQWHYGFEGITLLDDPIWEEIGTASGIDSVGATVHSGIRDCCLENLTTAYSGRTIYSATCTVTAGQGYYGGIWAYVFTNGGTDVKDVSFKLAVRWYNSSDAFISESSSEGIKLSAYDTWEKIIYSTVTAPAGATQARFVVAALETVALDYDPCIDDAEFIVAEGVTGDITPPSAVTDLSAATGTNEGEIDLTWSAPGDDGMTGTISSGEFRIKYSSKTDASDKGGWVYTSNYVSSSCANIIPSSSYGRTITGLTAGATYYFRIWTADEVPNWSGISNGAIAQAGIFSADITEISFNFGQIFPGNSAVSLSSATVTNTGNTNATYEIKLSTPPNWSAGTAPAADQFVFYVIFSSTQPTAGSFGAEDILSTATVSCTTTVFAGDENGVSVPSGAKRGMWAYFKAPTATSVETQQGIVVTLTPKKP